MSDLQLGDRVYICRSRWKAFWKEYKEDYSMTIPIAYEGFGVITDFCGDISCYVKMKNDLNIPMRLDWLVRA